MQAGRARGHIALRTLAMLASIRELANLVEPVGALVSTAAFGCLTGRSSCTDAAPPGDPDQSPPRHGLAPRYRFRRSR
jgi:hypothetical protein